MKKLLVILTFLLCATSAQAQSYMACQASGTVTVCPGDVRLKAGATLQAAYIPGLDAAKIVSGDISLARIATSLAAGGGAVKGTVVTATTRTETPTIGTDSTNQHAPPTGTGALVSTDATQTLTNKTLTSPTVSGPTLSGTVGGTYTLGGTPTFPATVLLTSGAQTITAQKTFPAAGANAVVIPAVRQTSAGNDISVPAASGADSFALLAQAQTLTNKTLTSPTISGPTLSGTIGGTYTLGGTPSVPATSLTGTISTARLPSLTAMGYVWANPVAASTTGLITPLAANSGSNSASGVTSPDVYRALQVVVPVGWDGGTVSVNGTDFSGGAITELFSTPGTYTTTAPFKTLTSVTKSAVGSSAATLTVGPAVGLGFPSGKRLLVTSGGFLTVNNVLDSGSITANSGNDQQITPATVPNGARTYNFIGYLQ